MRTHAFIRTALTAIVLALTACAGPTSVAPQPLQVSGLVFENRSGSWVSAIRLLVPATGGFVSCGNVAPGAVCSTTFPHRAWTGDALEVTWSQSGEIWSSGSLNITPGEEVIEAGEAEVRVIISAPGSSGVTLLPVTGHGAR